VTGPDPPTIDVLIDHAVEAISRGDRATANALAGRVLAVDYTNTDAGDLLDPPVDHGEIRRLTILFADLVDSTVFSTKVDPETYRTVVGHYRDQVQHVVDAYEGHIASIKGDGLLVVFGHPKVHENDVQRAIQAALEIRRNVAKLSEQARRRFGIGINVRVGVHRGVVYLDTEQDDVYGFAANLAARVATLAEPGTVVVSEAVRRLAQDTFELESLPAKRVKGVDSPVVHYRVEFERDNTRRLRGPLVGRQRELARLEASWAKAESGVLTVAGVAFHGDAGIGKSRLAGFAAELAERAGAPVLELIGSPFHTDVGLFPVRKFLERRCGIGRVASPTERLRLLVAELDAVSLDSAATVPLMAPVLEIAPDSGYQPVDAEGYRLHELIAEALRDYMIACLGDGGPGLVLAEDMHWFDTSTTEVVRALLGGGLGRTLVVMTSRQQAALPDASLTEIFEVKPLTDEETDQLIVALNPEMSDDARAAVRHRCDGVPLYIEEVVTKVKEQATDASESTGVPDTLYEVLLARLHSTDTALPVVQAAATIGSHFHPRLLRSVLAISDDQVDRQLEELRQNLVLEPEADHDWRFRHELLRELAAELPPPRVRRMLHSKIADALKSDAAQGDQDWPLIALHFERADRVEEAAAAYQQASAAARHRGSLKEARMYLSRALDRLEKMPQGPERDRREVQLRLRRGFLASAAKGSGNPQTTADFERCLELAATSLQADELFPTMSATFLHYFNRADLRRADKVVRSLRPAVEASRQWFLAENIAGSGMLQLLAGEFNAAREQLEEAVALAAARESRDLEPMWFIPFDPEVAELTILAEARWVLGDLDGADAAWTESRRRASGLGFPQGPISLCYEEFMEARMCIEAGRFDRGSQLADDLTARAEHHGFPQWAAVGATMKSTVAAADALTAEGDPDVLSEGIATLTAWVNACRLLDVNVFVPSFDGLIARLLIAVGEVGEARGRVNTGLQLAEETGMHYYDAELLRLRSLTHQDADTRRADVHAAIEVARRQGATVFALRAALDDYRLRGESARASVVDAMLGFPSDSTWPELARARALLV
jgi:class 3 adenylate cyclase